MVIARFLHRLRCGSGVLPAALLALAFGAAGASAADDSPADAAFKRLDRNGDGAVTFDEFVQASDERLQRMDANGDGNIGRDEFLAHHAAEAEQRIARILAEFDKKKTGRLALADLAGRGDAGRGAQRLGACDSDKDGVLTRAEYLHCRRRLAERWSQRVFAKYDKNGDGFIDRAERVVALEDFFARLDADGDGKVVREEFAAAHRRRLERRGAPPNRTSGDPDEPE
jgi:Ca2+-binding EF-hand superfamily protein